MSQTTVTTKSEKGKSNENFLNTGVLKVKNRNARNTSQSLGMSVPVPKTTVTTKNSEKGKSNNNLLTTVVLREKNENTQNTSQSLGMSVPVPQTIVTTKNDTSSHSGFLSHTSEFTTIQENSTSIYYSCSTKDGSKGTW